MEMNSVSSYDIVFVAWVREIVHLYIVYDTLPHETEAVLPKDNRVYRSLTDKKLAFKILGFVDQACLGITLRI